MTETALPRLMAAVKEFNVGKDTLVDFLVKKGLLTPDEAKPTLKLSMDMYRACQNEFMSDKDAKQKSDALEIPVYPGGKKPKDEELAPITAKAPAKKKEAPVAEEKPAEATPVAPAKAPEVEEAPVKAAEPTPTPAPVVEEKETEAPTKVTAPKVDDPKILGKIDLTTIDSSTKPKKVVKKEEPKEEKPKAKAKGKTEEAKPIAPPKVEAVPTPDPVEEIPEHVKISAGKLEGPKILGKIELPKNSDTRPKPLSAEERRKRVRKVVENKPHENRRAAISDGSKNQGRPGGGGGGGPRGGGGGNRPGGNRFGAPRVVGEIDNKAIQDKIRETQAKLAGNTGRNKGLKAKMRKQRRDELAEQMAAGAEKGNKLQLTEFISVSELASLMDVSFAEVIGKCMGLGIMVSINQRLDAEVIELVASEFGYEVEFIDMEQAAEMDMEDEEDDPADLQPRAPIVTIMGHVDHGKTSLLDYIRNTSVVAGEAGGITQHIGAYEVTLKNGRLITFLDTPGHEAFTAMRARGAKVTDIAIIVIAADDAVMPQTKEAISHAQAAGVPMVFAINKIDKDGANPQKIFEQLSQMNILVDEWGGKFHSQGISAKQGTNIEDLLEKVLFEADLLGLTANPNKEASGTIIEASLDKGRGYVATILVENGTLKKGDAMVSGQFFGRVKAMFNERQQPVDDAPPATPVVILGLSGAPQAGEKFKIFEDEAEAKEIANKRSQILREQGIRTRKHITLDEIGRRLALGNFKELKVIIKGDVDGSVEALSDSLQKLSTEEILVSVIHKAVGQINESDIVLAEASDAIIIGFNVRPSMQANRLAENAGIQIKMYSVIYAAIDEIKSAMEGMLEPTVQEKIVANVEIRQVFKFDKATVAGCYVLDGKISRNSKIRIVRDGIVVFPNNEGSKGGELGSLKRMKDDAKEVATGYECGLTIKNFSDIKVGDIVEAYEEEEVKRKL
jgi:translation initiation factor IF-2